MAKTKRSRSAIASIYKPADIVSSSNAASHATDGVPHPSPVKSQSYHPSPVKSASASPVKSTGSNFAEECAFVVNALGKIHPDVIEENKKRREGFISSRQKKKKTKKQKTNGNETTCTPVTDAVINTMLSQNTTAANQRRAFAGLKQAFPGGWEELANATDTSHIEDAIRVAGLAKIRAERMQSMLQTAKEERGAANFEYLQDFDSVEDISKELSRFKGMGPKTISCVCLFALGFPDFPVDTHVLRISQKLGWVSKSTSREGAYEDLNQRVPEEYKLDLHCLLVTHGKWCYNCAANGKPQFKAKDKWICPLVGMKSGKMDIKPKIEKQVKVKKERGTHRGN